VAAVLLIGGLAACAPDPTRRQGGDASLGGTSASASPIPAATFTAGGTASQNLPIFAATIARVWSSPDKAHGRAYVDALGAVGFDKRAMQVTNDSSTVGNPAESIEFSVRWGAECLVGQVGPAIGRPVASVLPVLGGGVCLLGRTRPIDW
jgi:hypothetical protein